MRKITVKGKEYQWLVGRSNLVIKGENFKKVVPVVTKGWNGPKWNFGEQITPSRVELEILEELEQLPNE